MTPGHLPDHLCTASTKCGKPISVKKGVTISAKDLMAVIIQTENHILSLTDPFVDACCTMGGSSPPCTALYIIFLLSTIGLDLLVPCNFFFASDNFFCEIPLNNAFVFPFYGL